MSLSPAAFNFKLLLSHTFVPILLLHLLSFFLCNSTSLTCSWSFAVLLFLFCLLQTNRGSSSFKADGCRRRHSSLLTVIGVKSLAQGQGGRMEARISSSLLSDRSVQTWRQVLHTLQRVEFVGWFVGGARVVCLNSALYRLKNLRSLVSDRVLRLLCDALMGERSSRPSLLYLRVNLLSPCLELKDKIKYIRV